MARRPVDVPALVDRVGAGDRRAIARAITLVENRDPVAAGLVRALYPRTGGAAVAGFTGPPRGRQVEPDGDTRAAPAGA